MCCESFKKILGGSNNCYSNKTSVNERQGYFRFLPKRKGGSVGKFCCIKIDDCIITSNTLQKCDYVFVQCSNDQTYFVELKGTKIQDAYNQVVAAISYFKNKNLCSDWNLRIGILAAKTTTKSNQKLSNLKEDFKRKKLGIKLTATNNITI